MSPAISRIRDNSRSCSRSVVVGVVIALVAVFVCITLDGFSTVECGHTKKDVSRKSIVFDIKTPKVFYCIQEKQSDVSKTIVKAKPLEKLCEFGGAGIKPKDSPSDCYNDVDETEFACDEKKRFLVSLRTSRQLRELTGLVSTTDDDLS